MSEYKASYAIWSAVLFLDRELVLVYQGDLLIGQAHWTGSAWADATWSPRDLPPIVAHELAARLAVVRWYVEPLSPETMVRQAVAKQVKRGLLVPDFADRVDFALLPATGQASPDEVAIMRGLAHIAPPKRKGRPPAHDLFQAISRRAWPKNRLLECDDCLHYLDCLGYTARINAKALPCTRCKKA